MQILIVMWNLLREENVAKEMKFVDGWFFPYCNKSAICFLTTSYYGHYRKYNFHMWRHTEDKISIKSESCLETLFPTTYLFPPAAYHNRNVLSQFNNKKFLQLLPSDYHNIGL